MKKVLKLLGIVLTGIVLLFTVIIVVLWVNSPGKIDPIKGGVSEIVRTQIGGIEQGMIIQSEDAQNPVLLFLHGGPGNPEYALAKEAGLHLEKNFTVCWWEQRGSGMSYSEAVIKEGITLDRLIEDTVEVTNYLRERFGVEKITLMGHSFGSFLGLNTVSRYPQYYDGYIGIGQVVNQFESERLACALMTRTAKEDGDTKTLEKLEKYMLNTPDDITMEYLMLRSGVLGDMGYGVYHKPISKIKLLMPILMAKEYTLKDKWGYAMGSAKCIGQPMDRAQFAMSLNEILPEIAVPAWFFHGVYDRQVSYDLAYAYYDQLKAPQKQFFSFEHSAHSPFLEEPERFMEILETIL